MSRMFDDSAIPHSSCDDETHQRVSFVPMVTIIPVMSRVDYTLEELERSWFDLEEMNQMRLNARTEANLVDSGILLEDTEFITIRGLEGRTKEGSKQKQENRMNAYTAVFFELNCQIEDEFFDDDMLAEAYAIYSKTSAMIAQTIGKKDEIEAMKINGTKKVNFFRRNFHKPMVSLRRPKVLTSSAA